MVMVAVALPPLLLA
jgi:hypothetical protein